MHKGGAKFPHLILQKYAKDYRGVHITATKNDIPKGKILLKIPRTLLITVELAKASPIGKLLSQLPVTDFLLSFPLSNVVYSSHMYAVRDQIEFGLPSVISRILITRTTSWP
jgi:hypothetical protein